MSTRPIVFRSTHRIKFSELDPYNHVRTAVYAGYYVDHRMEGLRERIGWGLATLAKLPFMAWVKRMDIAFVQPALGDQEITITSFVREFRGSDADIECTMSGAAGKDLPQLLDHGRRRRMHSDPVHQQAYDTAARSTKRNRAVALNVAATRRHRCRRVGRTGAAAIVAWASLFLSCGESAKPARVVVRNPDYLVVRSITREADAEHTIRVDLPSSGAGYGFASDAPLLDLTSIELGGVAFAGGRTSIVGEAAIWLPLTPDASRRLEAWSAQHDGDYLGVFLKGKLVAAPRIHGRLGGGIPPGVEQGRRRPGLEGIARRRSAAVDDAARMPPYRGYGDGGRGERRPPRRGRLRRQQGPRIQADGWPAGSTTRAMAPVPSGRSKGESGHDRAAELLRLLATLAGRSVTWT
jgi:acyl-CoA thioester hydrolase